MFLLVSGRFHPFSERGERHNMVIKEPFEMHLLMLIRLKCCSKYLQCKGEGKDLLSCSGASPSLLPSEG